MEELARSNPTAYRLLLVIDSWTRYIADRSPRMARTLAMLAPSLLGDLASIEEDKLRAGLQQMKETIGHVLDGTVPAAPPADGPDVGGDDTGPG